LVEDDDSMRNALVNLLDAAGFETAAYASGEALLSGGALDGAVCVISDLKLPGMSGLELLTELRSRSASTSVIVITAHDAPSVRDEAERRGAAAYFVKPFQRGTLLAAIERVAGVTKLQ
jgi:FixJ family two-component response regulator